MNIKSDEKRLDAFCLLEKLAEGKNAGEKAGWISPEEVREYFEMKKMAGRTDGIIR
ncbi:MAG: hypothetical protein LUG56_07050 [Lachnospiraceae bacterium]|nr:hypothetical protein [Lachnospiraceae bacterium]MCD7842211.1 hypothetical protein [Lachnospiraceae bacterium]